MTEVEALQKIAEAIRGLENIVAVLVIVIVLELLFKTMSPDLRRLEELLEEFLKFIHIHRRE